MDEFLACSDLCEEKGFGRQAELLRRFAGGGQGKAYIVAERGVDYNDENLYLLEDPMGNPLPGEPRSVFIDRDAAEREAARRNARYYRENDILAFGLELKDITDHKEAELNRRIGAILGRPFRILQDGEDEERMGMLDEPPPFPADATDEQMEQIVGLFKVRFFHVIEVDFGG